MGTQRAHALSPVPGGVRLPMHKERTRDLGIITAPLPKRLLLPLKAPFGAELAVRVQAGEQVVQGQLLAAPTDAVGIPIHAPVAATVLEIAPHPLPHPAALHGSCIVLVPLPNVTTQIEATLPPCPPVSSKQVLLERIRSAGVSGMGGAGFPSALKLSPRHPIQTLILNGIECEPYITADEALMRERPTEIIAGAELVAHLLGANEILIAIEGNKPEAADILRTVLDTSPPKVPTQVVVTPTRYPAGGEKQLVQELTGREVPSGGLPSEVGVACQNVATMAAIYRAVCLGQLPLSRIVTVTGVAVAQPANYEVLIGTPISTLLAVAGAQLKDDCRIVAGGPMMGVSVPIEAPVIKTTNGVLLSMEPSAEQAMEPMACIRCGYCAEVCPATLLPQQLYWFARSQEHEKAEQHHLFDCIECGACAYVCPSRIPLVQYYRAAKAEIRRQQREKSLSDRARDRFEVRQQREQQRLAEQEERRRQRREKTRTTAANSERDAIVKAAVERVRQGEDSTDKPPPPPST